MKSFCTSSLCLIVLFISATLIAPSATAKIQAQAAEAKADAKPEEKDDKKKEDDESEVVDTKSVKVKPTQLPPRFLRFHMWDGSIVSGEVGVEAIDVKTEFGALRVPVAKIVEFRPGLESYPQRDAEIRKLVEDLGAREFKVRESAHRALVKMGGEIINELPKFSDGGSAERKKHLIKIAEEIEEQLEDFDDEDSNQQNAMIRGDTVVTPDFSIVGKIQQPQFSVTSKFGDLKISVADIKKADRGDVAQAELRKTVEIAAQAFFQTTPTNTKLRVSKGDKIRITSSGVVQWTNWSTASGPDGITNQGQWNGVNCGTLMARIGKSGSYIKIGKEETIVAKASGVLYLGIAMRDNYASNNGYRWTGEYKAKIRVTPK